jgi:hypothetical protein
MAGADQIALDYARLEGDREHLAAVVRFGQIEW